MSEIKFCQHCGEKRVENASWCVSCGHAFQQGGSRKALVATVAAVTILSLVIFIGLRLTVLKNLPPKENQTQAAENNSNLPSGHPPVNDDRRLADLRAHADTGHADGLLELAEYLVAQSIQDRKHLAEASVTIERFLQSWPEHAYAQRMAGNIYFDMGQADKAVMWYERYLGQHPKDANTLTDLGTQLLVLDRLDEAIAKYKQALEIHPNFYNALFNLSVVYEKKDDEATAQSYREKATEVAEKYGKGLAPEIKLARLPEGDPHAVAPAAAAAPTGKYAVVETFFREHHIIGPKLEKFLVKDGVAQAWLRNFPMEAIPANMRQSLDAKIKGKLEEAGADSVLEMRNAADGKVMVTYTL